MEIIAAIAENTVDDAAKAMIDAASWADLLEIRLDYLYRGKESLSQIDSLLARSPKPLVLTNRVKSEGGKFEGSEKERLNLLESCLKFKPAMIDLELSTGETPIKNMHQKKEGAKLILSYHDFNGAPDYSRLSHVLSDMSAKSADVAKIVTYAHQVDDLKTIKQLFNQARQTNQTLAAFCMGPLGRLSRVLAPLWGNALSYCALERGREAAPGQMTGPAMKRVFDDSLVLEQVTPGTNLYGVLGHPAGHSLSPPIHNAAFRHLGLDCYYVSMDLADAAQAIKAMKTFGFFGLSVTRPHKIAVIKHLDQVDDIAKTMGAVNTISLKDGRYIGGNTDVGGMMAALNEHINPAGKTAIVAGAGGAARAAVYGLVQAGAMAAITNRTHENGKLLAKEFGVPFIPQADLKSSSADILINATPLGMEPWADQAFFPDSMFKPETVILDMVYVPEKTRLIETAQNKGSKTIGGLSMLLHQAALQFQTWTGQKAPLEVMEKAARAQLNPGENDDR